MLRVVCSWFAHIAGKLARPKVFTALIAVALIVGGAWMIAAGGLPEVFQVSQIFAPPRADSPVVKPLAATCDSAHMWACSLKEEEALGFIEIMNVQYWAEGYSPVTAKTVAARWSQHNKKWSMVKDWTIFWGTVETGAVVGGDNKPVTTLCLHMYAKRAQEQEEGSERYIVPHPFFLGFLVWPEVLVKCDRDRRNVKNSYASLRNDPPFLQPGDEEYFQKEGERIWGKGGLLGKVKKP
jgi:hypothetical protein